MKKSLRNLLCYASVLLVFISSPAFGQEPPVGMTGEALKQWLKTNYYDGKHTELGYTVARQKMYQSIDNENGTLTCVYSGYQMTYVASMNTNPSPINCEHTIPQSFFGDAEPMRSDIHHLFPSYDDWNSERSNHPFADIADSQTKRWMFEASSQAAIPTTNIDAYSESNGLVFEPREDHKGNCARAIFYFFTMYSTQVGDISTVGDLATLYQWHLSDPVDADEQARNAAIETAQGNRNPYIDYPDLVQRAWISNNTGPVAPTISTQSSQAQIIITWTNVVNETGYKLYRSTDNVNFTELASLAADVLQYADADVNAGTNYYYYVIAYNNEGNSARSNVVSAVLLSAGGGAGELFFSEYVEGSNFDKVVEIANFTGSSVDLSNYSIMKQSNGNGAWGSELQLTGTLASGDVYVVCHFDANSQIKSIADLIEPTSSWTMSFNGNDPIGLFKNGVYIDAIGNFNSTVAFGENITLIRKPSIASPSNTFSSNDWLQHSQGYIDNLGLHTFDPSINVDDLSVVEKVAVKAYPNPATEKIAVQLLNIDGREVQINLMDITGKILYSKVLGEVRGNFITEILVSHYNKGIYFIRVNIDGRLMNTKILIQ